MNYPPTTQALDSDVHPLRAAKAESRRLAGKRVAMVTYSQYPNDPRPRRALNALVEEGASVDLICLAGGAAPRREVLDGIAVLRIPLKHQRGGFFGYAYQYGAFILISFLVNAFRSLVRRYDLVYIHNMPDILVISALVPKALGAKVVLDQHDPMPELMMTIFETPPQSRSVRLLKLLERWSIARANLVITVNVACKRIFSSRSCHADKIEVVMNAPDSRIFPLKEPTIAPVVRPSDRPFVVMYHGSIVERNGLDLAVDAIGQLRDDIPNLELRVIGPNTPFLERIRQEVQAKNLESKVRFCGPKSLEQIAQELEQCDVGVIPNHYNAFTEINTPTRIFEYLAVGKPPIAPSTSGIRDYFDGSSLLFFDPGSSVDLASKIRYAFDHPREMLEIVRKGQRIYQAHSWENERETLVRSVSRILQQS